MTIVADLKILLVEDDEVDSTLISRSLKKTTLKYSLSIASTIGMALDLLTEQNFDVCLTDLHLGPDSGIDLIQKARKLGMNCPFVVLTGLTTESSAQESIYADADDYLSKDEITSRTLQRIIQHSIARRTTFNRSHELQSQYNKLQRLSTMGEMAISIAHEINNPLTGILGHVTLAKTKLEKLGADTEIYDAISRHLDSVEKLALTIDSTVKNTKNLFKQTSGQTKMLMPVKHLIDVALDGLQFHQKRSSVRITVECPDDIELYCMSNDIIQIVSNLVINSCNAILDLNEKWIAIAAERDADQNIIIEIVDSGARPDDKFCEEMVNKFVTTSEGGMGIGLSIVHRLITKLNGSIEIDPSRPNTTFKITLPPQEELVEDSRYSLLVVEDDRELNTYLCEKLQENGFSVLSCHGGIEAFDVFTKNSVDLVITDVSMPEGTGIELYSSIKANADEHGKEIVPFIFTTGNIGLGIDVHSKHTIQFKPYDANKLVGLVSSLIFNSAA